MDTFNHVPANDYSSQNTIIIFKSCLELNFCQAGTSLAVDEGCNGFFSLPPSPVEECEEGHLSFWKGSLFYKDHNTVCLTRPWPSDYLWCAHYVIHLVCLGEVGEEGRRKWTCASAPCGCCYTVALVSGDQIQHCPASSPSMINVHTHVLFCYCMLSLCSWNRHVSKYI